jgi:stress response protein YsnF
MATTPQSTLVAAFRSLSDVEAAADELKAAGINANRLHISSEGATTGRSASAGATQREEGFVGWLKRVFGAEDESERQVYERAYRSGNVLLAVDTPEQEMDRVAEILDRHAPIDIQRDTERTAETPGATTGQSRSIPVVEEEVRVGKRPVLRGGVRVYSSVREQPVEETVRLREERVRVDRQPVDRPATEADLQAGQEQVIEVSEYAEEPVISKQARVAEEVRVSKEARERSETVRDTVRNTEVNVEKIGTEQPRATASSSDLEEDFRRDFANRYGTAGEDYETYSPAYRYGYDMASDPRYRGRDFDQIESDLRADYGQRYPNSTWDKIKASVRYGWDKVTGRAKSASSR